MQNQQPNVAAPSEVLAAALENRAGEIGLAFLDTRRGRLRLTQFIETSRCRTHVRSALRASGAALVLVPSSSALAAVTAAAAAAVGSDDADADDADDDNNQNNQNSSVVLLGLAAAIAAEGLSPVPWPRSAFDDTRASAALQLAAGGWESKAAVEKAKYLSLGAAGALLHYFQHSMGSVPAERSLSISFEAARDCLLIDSATAAALCLVSSSSGGAGGSGGGGGGDSSSTSLFRVLAPGARTDAGRSLLRASLLQPLAHAPTIAARHEAVAELASEAATTTTTSVAAAGGGGGNNGGLGGGLNGFVATAGPRGDAVSRALRALPRDLDKALGILSLRPCRSALGVGQGSNSNSGNNSSIDDLDLDSAKATAAAASRVDSLARGLRTLRLALSALPALADALEGCSASLLVAVRANVGHPTFSDLANLLRRVLSEDENPLSRSAAAAAAGGFDGGDDRGEVDDDDDDEGEEDFEEDDADDDDGDDSDGDDGDARTQATSSRSARPLRRRRRRASQASKRVPLPRPPEPIRSAYAVRAERGGLLEAAREALSAAAAGAAAEAGRVRELGGGGGRGGGGGGRNYRRQRRRDGGGGGGAGAGGGSGTGDGGGGDLSPAWRACLSKAKLSHTSRKGFVVVLPKAPSSFAPPPSSSSSFAAAALRNRASNNNSHNSNNHLHLHHLPADLSLVSVRPRGGAIEVSTPRLAALNARAAAALADCLLLSEQALEAAAAACLAHADFLHRLADNVALLDALSAFAAWARGVRRKRSGGAGAGGGEGCVAVPRLVGPREPLALGGLRCALLESSSSGIEVVPNDVYLALMTGGGGGGGGSGGSGGRGKQEGRKGGGGAKEKDRENGEGASEEGPRRQPGLGCLHVVTGPNSGGKSTFLRAIGLAVVISQAGGLPPARVACLPVLTRLTLVAAGAGAASVTSSAASLGLRALASSAGFAEEASHLAQAIEAAREASPGRALTLLDEPGRGASAADGAPLAWAAAEALSCFGGGGGGGGGGSGGGSGGGGGGQRCVVATHHPLLSAMEGCYAFARSWHLVAECCGRARSGGGSGGGGLRQPPQPQQQPLLLRFAWKVAPGPCPVRHYGLALAPSVGIPRRVVAAAAAVASAIEGGGGSGGEGGEEEAEEAEKKKDENPPSLPSAQRSLLEAAHRLRCLAVALKAGADEGAIAAALSGLRSEAAGALRRAEEAGMVVEVA